MLGERVAGKYELKRLLGSGAMGAVYEGVHLDIGKRLAIKLIHPDFCESSEAVSRFRREARAASAVESDYIVQIYDFGRDEALGLYMVIEYLEGEDLEARLMRERWMSERDTVTVGVQASRGLAKAHAAGIIHRDLKPANLFLTEREDGSLLVKILDFGISKFESAKTSVSEPTLTAFGTTLGTPQYMSPEQCAGKVVLDPRTDVWSLCAVLYEMLAGEPAITDAGGHIRTMQRILSEDVAPLGERARGVDARIARVIDAGLARDRDKRIPSALTLAARLIEAMPDATSRPPLISAMVQIRPTDVSELAPPSSVAPSTDSESPITIAAPPPVHPPSPPAMPRANPVKLTDTGNPGSAKPPSSADPPSSNEESVAIFVREEALPRELLELRKGRKPEK